MTLSRPKRGLDRGGASGCRGCVDAARKKAKVVMDNVNSTTMVRGSIFMLVANGC